MSKNNEIRDELRGLGSPLADVMPVLPMKVDEGYFEGLPQKMLDIAKFYNTEDARLSVENVVNPFVIPENYFEELPDNIMAAITENSVVERMPKGLPFQVPEGYFSTLPETLLAQAKATGATRMPIPVRPRHKILRRSLQWAAAAIVVLGVGLGAYRQFIYKPGSPDILLANVSKSDIQDYIVQRSDVLLVSNVDNNRPLTQVVSQLNDVGGDDIEGYLNETGWESVE